MEELELFKKKLENALNKAYSKGLCLLPFLDEAKLGILQERMRKEATVKAEYFGGFQGSDRVRAILSQYEVKEADFQITVYQIHYNKKYYSLTHRSVLGSVMSLGVKREYIGDIVITDEAEVYLSCGKEISGFLKEAFHTVGNAPIELTECFEQIANTVRYDSRLHFVASLRLDVIIASAYGLSRSEAVESITNGLVFINHILTQNPSRQVRLNDEISVRHKGRVRLSEIGGTSKSGRTAVILAKRV